MLLKNILIRNTNKFESTIQKWADDYKIHCNVFDGNASLTETSDAVVLFHQDYNISKENHNIKDLFTNNNKFAHSIDINGTLIASVSSFVFWLENQKPANLLFIGDDKLLDNDRFSKFLSELAKRI